MSLLPASGSEALAPKAGAGGSPAPAASTSTVPRAAWAPSLSLSLSLPLPLPLLLLLSLSLSSLLSLPLPLLLSLSLLLLLSLSLLLPAPTSSSSMLSDWRSETRAPPTGALATWGRWGLPSAFSAQRAWVWPTCLHHPHRRGGRAETVTTGGCPLAMAWQFLLVCPTSLQ